MTATDTTSTAATTAPTATGTATARNLLFFLVTVVGAAPILAVRYLPFTDLPEHVAAIATVARLLPGGGGSTDYVLSRSESQYLLYDLLGAILTRIIGDANLANRLLLYGVLALWPYATRSLLRAMKRDDRAAFFAPAIIWNRALMIGFLP